ncbi:10483_t:CDS:2, partial [Racocetra persica]
TALQDISSASEEEYSDQGKKDDKVWNDVIKGDNLEWRFYNAKCKWYATSWLREHPHEIKVHLARNCDNAPENIKIKWQDSLVEETSQPIA